jgi:hypothetical protein
LSFARAANFLSLNIGPKLAQAKSDRDSATIQKEIPMAKMKNKKNNMSSRPSQNSRGSVQDMSTEQYDAGEDIGGDTQDTEETNYQAGGSRQVSGVSGRQGQQQSQGPRGQGSRQGNSGRSGGQDQEFDPRQLLDTAREFIEGHPGRATLIGALVGGAVAGLFATERGRSLVGAAYSYSRPMIADYARNFISSQSGDVVERALPQ